MTIRSLAFFVFYMKTGNSFVKLPPKSREEMLSVGDYHVFLAPYENEVRQLAPWQRDRFPNGLTPLAEINVSQEDYEEIVRQIYNGVEFYNVQINPPYRQYIAQYPYVQSSVEDIYNRNEKILSAPEKSHRSSGLVVGRVQSGKTRNYIGLILKAIENKWNVIIVLTSNSRSLGTQTRERISQEFAEFGVMGGTELAFMDGRVKIDGAQLDNGHFYWGVAIKTPGELERIKTWFTNNDKYLPQMKVMIIDDEADAASPNANKRFNFWSPDEIAQHIAEIQEEAEEIVANPRSKNARYRDGRIIVQWLNYLKDNGNILSDETLASLAECFYNGNSTKRYLENIYNNADLKKALNIAEFRAEEGIKDLVPILRNYFDRQQKGRGFNLHSRSTLVYFIRSIFQIEEQSSTINRQIRTIIDSNAYRVERTYNFACCSYIGYTATPFACLMNALCGESPLFPDFAYPLEKSREYFGVDEIFGSDLNSVEPQMNIVRPLATPRDLDDDNGEDDNEENHPEYNQNEDVELEIEDSEFPEQPLDVDEYETYFLDIMASKKSDFWIVGNLDDVQNRPGLFIEPYNMTCLFNEEVLDQVPNDDEEYVDDEEDEEEEEDEANVRGNGGNNDLPDEVDDQIKIRHHHGSLQSLKEAIAWAFCTAAARRHLHNNGTIEREGEKEDCWTTMLVNVTEIVRKHAQFQELIQTYVDYWCQRGNRNDYIQYCNQIWTQEINRFSPDDFVEIFMRPPQDYPAWDEMIRPENDDLNYIMEHAHHRVIQINSVGDGSEGQRAYEDARWEGQTKEEKKQARLEEGEKLWIICGGNVLSRGLTLAGLTCSYFRRLKKATPIDTFTQMGRWFGYRKHYELLPRLWMTDIEFKEYKRIAKLENDLHEELKNEFKAEILPGDEDSLQEFIYWDRVFSGRAFEMKVIHGFATAKSTDYISINPQHVSETHTAINNFLCNLEQNPERCHDNACSMFNQYPAWRSITADRITELLNSLMDFYPEKTQKLFQAIILEIQRFSETQEELARNNEGYERDTLCWDVVVGTELDAQNNCKLWGNNYVKEGHATPDSLPNEPDIVQYHFVRAPNAFYAVISDYAILKADLKVLQFVLGLKNRILCRKIEEKQGKNKQLPVELENGLPQGDSLEQRIQLLLDSVDCDEILQQRRNGVRDIVTELLSYLNGTQYEGYRTRHKRDYQKLAYRLADHDYPVLQIYPVHHDDTNQTLIILSFFWPDHNPGDFQRAGIKSIEDKATVKEFYETVRDVLEKNDFPLGKAALHNAIVFSALRYRFSRQDFLAHIQDADAQNDYYRRLPVQGLNEAYYAVSWAENDEEAIAKFNDALLDTARRILWEKARNTPDDKRIKCADLYRKVAQTRLFISLLNQEDRNQCNSFRELFEQRGMGGNIRRTVLQNEVYFEYIGEIEQ